MIEMERTRIDTLMLANHAEAINGLLYISGGGWTDHHRRIQGETFPNSHFGIALSLRVPWHETNQPHKFVVEVQNDDATVTVMRAEGEFNVGRPAQLSPPPAPPGPAPPSSLGTGGGASVFVPSQHCARVLQSSRGSRGWGGATTTRSSRGCRARPRSRGSASRRAPTA